MSTLPHDVARCEGVGNDESGWREGCENCLRRTARSDSAMQVWMAPPQVIAFFCEAAIEPHNT